MCSIYGAFGNYDHSKLQEIKTLSKLRGRDAEGFTKGTMMVPSGDGPKTVPINWLIGNNRATPTTELDNPTRLQPYDGVVHNGTIANDKELGNPPGAVDSEIIPKVLDRTSIRSVATSLGKLKGSYALAIVGEHDMYLAANYKPLYYYASITPGATCIYFASLAQFLDPVVEIGHRPCKLEPYTVLSLSTLQSEPIPRIINERCLAIASAGLDSTVAAKWMQTQGYEVELLHFQYGCKAEDNEVSRIKAIAERMGTKVHFLPLGYSAMAGNSPLLQKDDNIAGGLAGAEYAHEWVPARNLVMLSLAVAFAEANNFSHLCLGTNLEESGAYPDNEGEFINLFNQLLPNAVNEGNYVRVHQPVGHLMKHEIVKLGAYIRAPMDLTWSCYRNGDTHCGQCGPCFMRKTAFDRNGIDDPAFT